MASVFIVSYGADCEGSEIVGVFAKKEDAIKLIDERCQSGSWIRKSPGEARSCYEYEGRLHEGCNSIIMEEWEVK